MGGNPLRIIESAFLPGQRHLVVLRWKSILVVAVVFATAVSARPDDFDALRLKWRDMLTQGTNCNPAIPLYSNWIAEVESSAYSYLLTLNASSNRSCNQCSHKDSYT